MTIVYVLMCNDFPEAVFFDEKAAHTIRNKLDKQNEKAFITRETESRIYWHVESTELNPSSVNDPFTPGEPACL